MNALNDKSDNESQSKLDSPTNVRPSNYTGSSPQNTQLQIISATPTENCKRNNNNGSSAMQHPRIMVPGMSKTPTIHNFGNNINYDKPKGLQLQASKKHGTNTTNTDNVDTTNGKHIGNDSSSLQNNSSSSPTITNALYQIETNQLKCELEAKDKTIKSKEINLEQEKKDIEHSLVIARKRIKQLEGIKHNT
ncbi:unnamed protein product [Mytilus edulis]|uniref:Uncharacterized protein n=1 Tax=Mytilus edulis TaxID=6550 RepID=A0A8S3VED1_MYTED|nr:unnamed protein product [Mytilus edulis]